MKYLITDSNITVHFNGETHIVARGSTYADKLISALKEGRDEEVPGLVSAKSRIENFSEKTFTVENGEILVNGIKAPEALGKKILKFANDGLPYQPLVKFAENLQRNPSARSVEELFLFLEANDHPIAEDGRVIFYKRVRGDFKDIYTGTFDNSPGSVLAMPREEVDPDANKHCSTGFHASAWLYCHSHYASKDPSTDVIVEVIVDPADVVSVPSDYGNAKIRVSRYQVLGVIDKQHSADLGLRVINKEEPVIEEEEFCDECENDGEECICRPYCDMCDTYVDEGCDCEFPGV